MLELILQAKKLYERYERFNPFVFFFGGFTWDSVTLKRIDQLLDNLVLLSYLVGFGVLMSITLLVHKNRLNKPFINRHAKWFPLILQFFLGGLFSAYVVFYFQSASFTKTSVFLMLLVGLLIANEFLKDKLKNIYLLLVLYFLATFSFFIFFIPVLFKSLSVWTFLSGGLLSLGILAGLIYFYFRQQIFDSWQHLMRSIYAVGGLYLVMNLLYFVNWIPPVPLSLKTGGIYHHASRSSDSDKFLLKFEEPKWYQFFKMSDEVFHYSDGDTVSCFTAVFAPTELKKRIRHHWQRYSETNKTWESTDRLGFNIIGYREGGYRGITRKKNIAPGEWRVDVETEEGVLLGRIGFEVVAATRPIDLKTVYR